MFPLLPLDHPLVIPRHSVDQAAGMVERGHHDQVSHDRLVAYEYAKVLWLYVQFGLADNTQMEYFNGGHTVNGEGTFEFLRKNLDWPRGGSPIPEQS